MTDDSIPCEVGPIHMVQRLFKVFEYFMTWKCNFNKNTLFGTAIVRSWLYKQIKYLLRLLFREACYGKCTAFANVVPYQSAQSIKCGTRWVRLLLIVAVLYSASSSGLFFGFRSLVFQNSASIGMKAWHRHFLDNKPPITAACRLVALECPFEVSSFMDTWTYLGFTGRQIFLVGALPNYRLINFCNW